MILAFLIEFFIEFYRNAFQRSLKHFGSKNKIPERKQNVDLIQQELQITVKQTIARELKKNWDVMMLCAMNKNLTPTFNL